MGAPAKPSLRTVLMSVPANAWMMHEIMIERRNQIKIGNPRAGNQLKRSCGIELRQTDERAADERHR